MSEQKISGSEVLISVVIPVKDEQESIGELYRQLTGEIEKLGKSFELLFVNDGSEDGTEKVLADLHEKDRRVRVVEFTRNFGKSAALNAGFALARGAYLVMIDGDLQDDPKELGKFLAKLDEGYDLVSGWKANRQDPLNKIVLSRIYNTTLRWISGVKLHDFNCGFKGMKRESLEGVQLYGDLHRYLAVMIAHRGFKVTEIPVEHHARRFGKSKFGFGRVIRGFFDLLTIIFITQYAYRPLHLFGSIGVGTGFLGFAALGYLTVLWFLGERPIGTRPLFMGGTMLLLLGAQMLSLGLIGELLLKLNIRNEPPYTIKRLLK